MPTPRGFNRGEQERAPPQDWQTCMGFGRDKPFNAMHAAMAPRGGDPRGGPSNGFETQRLVEVDSTHELKTDLKDLMTYVKDVHWLGEKNMLITEKILMLLDDLQKRDKVRGQLEDTFRDQLDSVMNTARGQLDSAMNTARSQAPPPGAALDRIVQDSVIAEQMSQTIRESIAENMRSVCVYNVEKPSLDPARSLSQPAPLTDPMGFMRESSTRLADAMGFQTEQSTRPAPTKATDEQMHQVLKNTLQDQSTEFYARMDAVMIAMDQQFNAMMGGISMQVNQGIAFDTSLSSMAQKVDLLSTQFPRMLAGPGAPVDNSSGHNTVLQAEPDDVGDATPSLKRSGTSYEDVDAISPAHTEDARQQSGRKAAGEAVTEGVVEPTGDIKDGAEEEKHMTTAHMFDRPEDAEGEKTWPEKFVSCGPFEMFFGLLIALNTLTMCAEAEYFGAGTGHLLGVVGMSETNASTDQTYKTMELAFGAIFTLEVILKILALRCKFPKSAWNIFDFTVIAIAWLDLLLDIDLFLNPMLLRLVRLVRLLRLLRGLSAFEIFDNLHLMVRGIKGAMPVLVWVVLLVFPALASFALGMNYLLLDFMEDESQPMEDRLRCYMYFGTFTKAMLSMFEVTFASFVPICRFLYTAVDAKFALFFMAYQLVMGIAVIRIIYGVFLHVTFACATSDDDTLIAKKNRENRKFADKMHELFTKFDASGDGYLTREEFAEIAQNPVVKTWLSTMDLELTDTDLVFDLADGGDEKMCADEMVFGFSRLKGTARSIDIWALIGLVRKAMHEFESLQRKAEKREMAELAKIEGMIESRDEEVKKKDEVGFGKPAGFRKMIPASSRSAQDNSNALKME